MTKAGQKPDTTILLMVPLGYLELPALSMFMKILSGFDLLFLAFTNREA